MNPSQFRAVADRVRVCSDGLAEACSRTAISRYYYAVFLEARNRIEADSGVVLKPWDKHEQVRKAFARSTDPELSAIGLMLGALRKLRTEADYDLHVASDPTDLREAERLCNELARRIAVATVANCVDPATA